LTVQRQGGLLAHVPGGVGSPDFPAQAVPAGVFQVLVAGVVIADMVVAAAVDGQGGVQAHVSAAVDDADLPGAAVPAGEFQVAVAGVIVADGRAVERIDGDGGIQAKAAPVDGGDAQAGGRIQAGRRDLVAIQFPCRSTEGTGMGRPDSRNSTGAWNSSKAPASPRYSGGRLRKVWSHSRGSSERGASSGSISRLWSPEKGRAAVLKALLDRADLPVAAVVGGVFQGPVEGVVVADVRAVIAVQRQGGILTHPKGVIDRFAYLPGAAGPTGVVEVVAAVGDMRVAGGGGVQAQAAAAHPVEPFGAVDGFAAEDQKVAGAGRRFARGRRCQRCGGGRRGQQRAAQQAQDDQAR
jgi:hypothetical protein